MSEKSGNQTKSGAATLRLSLTGDAMLKLLQTKQMSTREEARACMELMRHANPELVRWVNDVTAEAKAKDQITDCLCVCGKSYSSYNDNDLNRHSFCGGKAISAGGSATARPDARDDEPADYLVTARGIAYAAHAGQMSRYGNKEPYIQHVQRVVALMASESERAVAWLHDVLEDSPITTSDLSKLRIPGFVIDAVVLLTRPPTGHHYSWYIERLAHSYNALAIRVKLADLQDHLGHNPQFLSEAQRDRYRAAYATLGAAYEKLNRSFPSS